MHLTVSALFGRSLRSHCCRSASAYACTALTSFARVRFANGWKIASRFSPFFGIPPMVFFPLLIVAVRSSPAARRPYFGRPLRVFLLKIVLRTIFSFFTASDGVSFFSYSLRSVVTVLHLQLVCSAPYGRAGSLRSRLEVRFAFFSVSGFPLRIYPCFF